MDFPTEQTQQFSQPVKIVRTSNRRKFLVGLLGSAAILAVGSPGLWQLAQNLQVAFNTKNYPYNFGDDLVGESYSPDLNFMAMTKVRSSDDPNAKLYIWDYQQQRMTTLSTGPDYGDSVWSSDNRYLLYQAYHSDNNTTLDLWNVQKQQKMHSYGGENYAAFSEIHWSPDDSRIALNLKDDAHTFVVMSSMQLKPLFTFNMPTFAQTFIWSPDGQKVAFLVRGDKENSSWSIQIWDLQSRKMESDVTFQGQQNDYLSDLAWSPDGAHIAAVAHGQLQIVQVGQSLTSYALDEPNKYGKLAWSPDGRHLAVAVRGPNDFLSGDKLGVWDIAERKLVRVFHRGQFPSVPDALAWSKDGKSLRIIADVYKQENWSWQ